MSITVSLKIEVDATASLSELEQQIQEAGRAAMKEAPKQAIGERKPSQKPCPQCGSGPFQNEERSISISATTCTTLTKPMYL